MSDEEDEKDVETTEGGRVINTRIRKLIPSWRSEKVRISYCILFSILTCHIILVESLLRDAGQELYS